MKLTEKICSMLTWAEATKIVEDEISRIVGHPVPCSPLYMDDSYWGIKFEGRPLPLSELCMILQALHASKEFWEDILPDESSMEVHDIGSELAEQIIRQSLGLSWEHHLLEENGLWLVDVTKPPAQEPETVSIGGTDVYFAELKSKEELFNFFHEGTCDHAALMEFCEDYKTRYENDLCWPYPIATDNHLGRYLVLVREGILGLPYDGFDGENYEFFSLEGAELLNCDQLIELADAYRMFTNDLLAALNDMIIYTQAKERKSL